MLADAGTGLVLMCQLAAGVWEFDMIQSALTKPEQACLVLACLLALQWLSHRMHTLPQAMLHARRGDVSGCTLQLTLSKAYQSPGTCSSCVPVHKQLPCCALVYLGVGGRAGMHVWASIWKS